MDLAVVWSKVEEHNGYINVTSGEHETCFDLYFPVSGELPNAGNKQSKNIDLQGCGQTVLEVDDEATRHQIGTSLLNRLGYKKKPNS